jgi:hypothetical protein
MSRSGQVFLVADVQSRVVATGAKRAKKLISLKTVLPVFVLMFVAAAVLLPQIDFSVQTPTSLATPDLDVNDNEGECKEGFLNPTKQIENWLLGNQNQGFEISEGFSNQIGGVELKVVTVTCNQLSQTFRITLVKDGNTWNLNKFARLEN